MDHVKIKKNEDQENIDYFKDTKEEKDDNSLGIEGGYKFEEIVFGTYQKKWWLNEQFAEQINKPNFWNNTNNQDFKIQVK